MTGSTSGRRSTTSAGPTRPVSIHTVPRTALEALVARVRREIGARPVDAMVAGFNRSTVDGG